MAMTTCEGMDNGSIATANWEGDDAAIYYVDVNHNIRERTYHKQKWNGGKTTDVIISGSKPTPLAAMQWFWKEGGVRPKNSIRVYFTDAENRIHEYCWDGLIAAWPQQTTSDNWWAGELDQSTHVTASNSKLAAVHWGASLRVYFQTSSGTIQEHCRDYQDPWYRGSSLPCPSGTNPYSGTALAAISRNPSSPEVFVWFQCADSWIYQAKYGGSWGGTTQLFRAKPGTPLTAAVIPGENAIRLYCADETGRLAQYKGEPDTWKKTSQTEYKLLEGSSLATVVRNDNGKEKVVVFHADETVAKSADEARKTDQGSIVLDPARGISKFTNLSYLHYGNETTGTTAVSEFV